MLPFRVCAVCQQGLHHRCTRKARVWSAGRWQSVPCECDCVVFRGDCGGWHYSADWWRCETCRRVDARRVSTGRLAAARARMLDLFYPEPT